MDVGDLLNQETQVQADFVQELDFDGINNPAYLAVGASYLDESFEIVEALDAEDTVNYTLGFTASIGDLTLTVDACQIEIEGRVNSVSNRSVSNAPANAEAFANFQLLVANGVPNPESLGELNWYANTFDTANNGVDIVATYNMDWGGSYYCGRIDFSL